MADIEAATDPPQAPPPTRRRRAAAAAAAAALRWLLALAAGAFLCWFLVVLWVINAANAALIAVRWTCGEDSRAAAVALEFAIDCSVALRLLLPVVLLLLLWRLESLKAKAREIGQDGGVKKPASEPRCPESTGARGCLDGLYDPIPVPFVVLLFMFLAVGLLMQELDPAKGSSTERIGSKLIDIFVFIHALMICFAIFPNIVIRLRTSCTKLNC